VTPVRDLLVVVLEVDSTQMRAGLAEVDRPGELVRDAVLERGRDLVADAAGVLTALAAGNLAPRLLALSVAVHPAVPDDEAAGLLAALTGGGAELAPDWPLPPTLPVRAGSAAAWERAGSGAPLRPLVAGAAVAAARSVGAHAHLPRS
jgi:hypothetical protein